MSGFKLADREKLPDAASITCPRCTQAIPVITQAQAVNIGCPHCHFLLQLHRGYWTGVKSLKQHKIDPVIPIGAKGRLNDVLYQVVGFIVYTEATAPYMWREYVLFNPLHGYAFLSEYDGHWIFFKYLADLSLKKTQATSIFYGSEEYKLYNRYRSKVQFAMGEFPWKVLETLSSYAEYVAPPRMLVQQVSADETSWMQGEHKEPAEIKEAFQVTSYMPQQIGVGAIEPFGGDFSPKKVVTTGGIAAGILVALFILFMVLNGSSTLADQGYTIPSTQSTGEPAALAPMPGPTIDLHSIAGSSNVEFELYAPVSNDWFALQITLINTKTNQAYDFELGTEFYEGYSEGTHWTEGSTMNEIDLSALPDGKYNTILLPYRSNLSKVDNFRIWVRKGVPLWSNFWIVLLLIALVPGILWIRHHSHEKSRWMNSDYSPYTYE